MSDAHVEGHGTAAASTEPLFNNAELREFANDDVVAGRAIGKMLSLLFIYTLFAMSIVAAWTMNSVNREIENRSTTPSHATH